MPNESEYRSIGATLLGKLVASLSRTTRPQATRSSNNNNNTNKNESLQQMAARLSMKKRTEVRSTAPKPKVIKHAPLSSARSKSLQEMATRLSRKTRTKDTNGGGGGGGGGNKQESLQQMVQRLSIKKRDASRTTKNTTNTTTTTRGKETLQQMSARLSMKKREEKTTANNSSNESAQSGRILSEMADDKRVHESFLHEVLSEAHPPNKTWPSLPIVPTSARPAKQATNSTPKLDTKTALEVQRTRTKRSPTPAQVTAVPSSRSQSKPRIGGGVAKKTVVINRNYDS